MRPSRSLRDTDDRLVADSTESEVGFEVDLELELSLERAPTVLEDETVGVEGLDLDFDELDFLLRTFLIDF